METSHETYLTSANNSTGANCTSAKLYSTKEAAKFLHLSLRTFKYLTSAKHIQPVQTGARQAKFYSEEQLLTYAKGAKVQNDPCKDKNCTPAPVQKTMTKERKYLTNLKYIPTDSEISAMSAMTNEARAELAARINATDPYSIFDSVEGKEGKEIICPICGSGSGKNHTGIKPTFENGKWLYNCFACGSFSGDLISVIAAQNNLSTKGKNYFQVLAIGAKIIGNFIPADVSKKVPAKKNKTRSKSVQKVAEFSRLAEARKNLKEGVFIGVGDKWRGISHGTLVRLDWGFLPDIYFPDAKKELPAIVIPNDLNGIFARAVEGKFYRNNTPTATTTIYLPNTAEFDLVIVEGAINGASILEIIPAPNFGIIASGGTSGNENVLSRLNQLAADGKKFRVMVAYDNDKGGAGQKAAAKLLAMLKKSNIVATSIDITKTADIDLNDVLRNEGRGELKEMVNLAVDAAQIELEKVAASMQAAPTCANDDSDLAAQIEHQKRQQQAAEKEIAAFNEEKEAAIEKLKSIEKFDFDTVFSAEIISGAAFAKLYDKTEYARACVDISTSNKTERFLKNWQSAVKDKAAEIAARANDLKIKVAEISAEIDTLKFRFDNDILKNYDFPKNFSITKAGEIVKIIKGVPFTICRNPVVITKEFFGVDTKFFKYGLTFKKDRKWQEIPPLEQAIIADSKKLIPAVANYGLQFNSTNASGVVDYLDAILAKNAGNFKKIYTARQFGWQEYNGKEFFLEPRRNCAVEVEGVKVPFVADNTESQFAKSLITKGSINEWKKAYKLAKKYHFARFIVAACVAAPLLKILGLRNFALYFRGKSRAGKTSSLVLGVSAVGNEKMVRTFDATKNGLLGAAAESNDYVFAVDEKQSADKKISESLANFVYDYCEGRPRTKLNRDSSLRAGVNWRGVLVATGETPLYADNVTEGANTRAIQFTVKEILPREICAEIRQIIKKNYGHILPLIIDKIFEYGFENLREDFKAYVDDFSKRYPEILPEYCANIAAVALADSLLNQVLGVEKKDAEIDAAELAYEILKSVPTIKEISDTEREKDFVTAFIAQNSARFEGDNKDFDAKGGTFGKISNSKGYIFIISTVLEKACIAANYDYKKLAADLVENNFFIAGSQADKDRKNPRYTVQEEVGIGKPRCFRIPLEKIGFTL